MCRGCTVINIVEVFFKIVGEQGHTVGYLDSLDSGHIVYSIFLCNKGVVPKNYYFRLYSN